MMMYAYICDCLYRLQSMCCILVVNMNLGAVKNEPYELTDLLRRSQS